MPELLHTIWNAIIAYWHRFSHYNMTVVAIQLALIGVVVWLVLRFLRGTRGATLVKGVALLMVSAYVAIQMLPENLEWDRIKFLYGNFLVFAFVAVVVAFQPELRRAFTQIGQARLFRGSNKQAVREIDELMDTAAYLSRNKIGAVVAVERTVGLNTLAEAGTMVDSRLSAALMNTIFYPGSMLHDMGVIVRDGRIIAAGCQFPLAESGELDPSLGTRHRAALGLAQETDAVVLVVSEETGRVSIACDGQLYVGLEREALRQMLLGLIAPRAASRREQQGAA